MRQLGVVLLALGIALLTYCSRATPQPPGVPIGDSQGTLQVGNVQRTYYLHVPASYDAAKPTPLVLAFHGGGGTGKGMVALTGFSTLSDQKGFIVAYPDAIDKHWNDGRVVNPTVDDVTFVSGLVEHLAGTLNIDRKRVYATGISNGGIFSNKLGCELSGQLAAIGPVAGTLAENDAAHCAPKQPVSVIAFHGTDDPLVPFNGGTVRSSDIGGIGGNVLSASDTAAHWAKFDGCTGTPALSDLPDADTRDGTRVQRVTLGSCQGGNEVVLYMITGGGHTWPGGLQYLPALVIGRTSRDIDATQLIWEFFAGHPK